MRSLELGMLLPFAVNDFFLHNGYIDDIVGNIISKNLGGTKLY